MQVLRPYLIVVSISSLILLLFAIKCFSKKKISAKYLGFTLVFSLCFAIFYVCANLTQDDFASTIFTSLHFASMDFLVMNLLSFIISFTDWQLRKKYNRILIFIIHFLTLVDVCILLINPFANSFAIQIVRSSEEIIPGTALIRFRETPFLMAHLTLCYLYIGVITFLSIKKIIEVPREYKLKFIFPISGVGALIVINAGYLFLPDGPWNILDYSILLYGLVSLFFYWCNFKYATDDMVNKFKTTVFETIDQAIVLFDYIDELMIYNSLAEKYFPTAGFKTNLTLEEFVHLTNIEKKMMRNDDIFSFQYNLNVDGKIKPLRCDFRKVFNADGKLIAKSFVFADMSNEIDLLTDFQTWESFKRFANENVSSFSYPLSIAVCDIVGLGIYNEVNGKEAGDELLRELADLMKEEFGPEDAHYIRGREASLIALLYNVDNDCLKEHMENITNKFHESLTYCTLVGEDESKAPLSYIVKAFNGINAKRLLDKRSTHSSVISSLVKALQQCDTDTEEHVKRTQIIGTELGKRLGLSDIDLSDLSLLCLLHDIGKIGVPLEILNKPGKLTQEEFESIKTHTIKGYNIAMSSDELQGIALMIKHHHERWDGKGYPDGLSRESIPLLSRIIAVVDAFDAMVNNRSYRRALSYETARNEILNNAGTQFDPRIASTFLQLLDDEGYYRTHKEVNIERKVKEEVEPIISDESINDRTVHVFPINYSKYILNEDNKILQIDERFTEITGYTMQDVIDRDLHQYDLIPSLERAAYASMAIEQIGKHNMAYFEHRIICKDGSSKFVLCLGTARYDSVAKEPRTDIIICDAFKTNTAQVLSKSLEVKSRKRLEQWEEMYRKDSLTGLLTHRSFQSDVEELLLKGKKVALFMIDIDYFKEYNDTYGHHAGDEFLINFSQAMLSYTSKSSLCCRIGGDEFAVASVDYTESIESLAERAYSTLEFILTSNKYPVSCSVGVCESNDKLNTFNRLYENADKVMYVAKRNGKSRYAIYKED